MEHPRREPGSRVGGRPGGQAARALRRVLLPAVVAGASVGCLGPRVVVLPSGPGIAAEPRAPDCKVDIFRARPDVPFDELAALHAEGGDTFKDGPGDFQDALRAKACGLGADAVLVTQDYSGRGGAMNAVAIKYRPRADASR